MDNTKELKPNQCRQAFEKWAVDYGFSIYRGEDNGNYRQMSTDLTWTAWQAAYAARPEPTEGDIEASAIEIWKIEQKDGNLSFEECKAFADTTHPSHDTVYKLMFDEVILKAKAALNAYINGR